MNVLLPGLTSLFALVFAVALFDQWRERRRGFQAVWAIGMIFFAIASGAETVGAVAGWNDLLYRTWYLAGAVSRPPGSASARRSCSTGRALATPTALLVILGGLIAFAARNRYPDAGDSALLIVIAALIIGLAVMIETYFQNERWPTIAAIGVVIGTVAAAIAAFALPLVGGGYTISPVTAYRRRTPSPAPSG